MRSIFVLTMMMFALLVGAFYYAFYTPALVQKAAPAFIEKYVKEVTLNSLRIGGQSIAYPEVLKLYNIRAEFQWENETYELAIAELDFLNFQTFIRTQQQALIDLSGVDIHKKDWEILNASAGLTVNLNDKSFDNCLIVLRQAAIKIAPYKLTGIQARIEASRQSVKIPEFKAQAYGGGAKGKISLTFTPKVSEEINIEFWDMKSTELALFNKRLFAQVSGDFNGTLKFSRAEGLIAVLAIFAEIPKGGTLSTNLGKKISGYIVDEETLGKITDSIEKKGKIEFDNAQVRILKLNERVAGVSVTLENKKDNLSIHETINMDMSRILAKFDWKK